MRGVVLLFWGLSCYGDTVTLTWEAPGETPVSGYKVYRAKNVSDPFVPVATTIRTQVSISSPGLADGHLYYVTAVDAEGAESSPSNVIEIGKTLGVRVEPDVIAFEWNDSRYLLETAPTLEGPWAIFTSNSPAFSSTARGMGFFRLKNLE